MATINLHKIFCRLTDDDHFLSTIIEEEIPDTTDKKKKKGKCNLMMEMVMDYNVLSPYETQSYTELPYKFKPFFSENYYRVGIQNIIQKNISPVNISFLSSLNLLLRPDLHKQNIDEQIHNFHLLESFVINTIRRNYRIDKIKNTKKMQAINNELINNLQRGIISEEIIDYVVNIFEINLLIFDFTKMDINLYWTAGTRYPYFNLFKNIYCMSYIHGNYEPLMSLDETVDENQRKKIYVEIFNNLPIIKTKRPINLGIPALVYLNTWDINEVTYLTIIKNFFNKPMICFKKLE